MILLFFILQIVKNDPKMYISIKPIEEICLLKDEYECPQINIILKITINRNKYEIFSFIRSKRSQNLRENQGFTTITQFNYKTSSINQHLDNKDNNLILFKNVENLNIDYNMWLADWDVITGISLRLKLIKKTEIDIKYNAIYITITYKDPAKIDTTKEYLPLQLTGYTGLSFAYPLSNHEKNEHFSEEIHVWYSTVNFDRCKELFTYDFKFKHNNSTLISKNDKILERYRLEGLKEESNHIKKVKYIYHDTTKIQETEDYTDDPNIQCNNICKDKGHCEYKENDGFYDAKCTCPSGYGGRDCKNKLSCVNCVDYANLENGKNYKCKNGWKGDDCKQKDCESLGMCGEHGTCEISTNGRKCRCSDSYTGAYCSKKTQLSKHDNASKSKSGNIKLAIAVSLGCVILIIIASVIIYCFKVKK